MPQNQLSKVIQVPVPTSVGGGTPVDVSMFRGFTLWFQINGATGTWVCEGSPESNLASAIWQSPNVYALSANTIQNFAPEIIHGSYFSHNVLYASRMRSFRLYCSAYTSGTPLAFIVGEYL